MVRKVLTCAVLVLVSSAMNAAQQVPGGARAGDTRKHQQVLQDVPESQIFLVMNYVAKSLGVNCDYCHVKEGDKWVWDRDDKPKKAVGLRMIRMVRDINTANYQGAPAVTCYTCHRGSLTATPLPSLPPRDLAGLPIAGAAAVPTPAVILQKYVDAVGGLEAVGKVQTLVLRGTDERSEGRRSAIEITIKGPDKLLITRTTADQPPIAQAIDGGAGWQHTQTGFRTLSAADVALVRRAAIIFQPLKVPRDAALFTSASADRIGDRDVYVLETETAGIVQRFFFDAKTGLLVRRLTLTPTLIVTLPEQADFDDYRDIGGVRVPFSIRTADVAYFDTASRTFSEIRQNVPIDDSVFAAKR